MSQTFKLSPLVTEEELTALDFTKGLGHYYLSSEIKKGVQLCLAIDFETKNVWIAVDNDNLNLPEATYVSTSEDDGDYWYHEDDIHKKCLFDLGFEIPEAFIQMLINGQIYIKKGE